MDITTLVSISILLFAVPIVSLLLYSHKKSRTLKPLSGKTCFILYSALAIYYAAYFVYGSDLLNHYFPIHSETKMVCENKTTSWREGVKY